MLEKEVLEIYKSGFEQLSKNDQQYIIAIQQALLFAQRNADPTKNGSEKSIRKLG